MSDPAPPDALNFSTDDLGLLQQMLAESGIASMPGGGAIPRRGNETDAPLSYSQELLWLLDRASPGMTAYNMPIANRLSGLLDLAALELAINDVVARHEALRTRFISVAGEPAQRIDPPGKVRFTEVDLRSIPAVRRDHELKGALRSRAAAPFDMEREHLFRATVVRLAEDDHVLLLETHHIVCDGWSLGIFWRELAASYAARRRGEQAVLPPVGVQYGDYAAWQRQTLRGERLEQLLAYWREQLGASRMSLDLPTDFPRPLSQSFAGGRATLLLPPDLLERIKQRGREHDATLYMMLLTAYMTVLHRYTGREQVLVGSGSAGRTRQETEETIGYLNNTLVQRGDFSGNPTFAQVLGRVRHSALGAYDHQEVPLEKLVLELRSGAERFDPAPLFQVVFTMQNAAEARLALEGIEVRSHGVEFDITKFDMTLLPGERPEGLLLFLRYRFDLYTPAAADRFLGHMRRVLEAAVVNPEQPVAQLPLLTPEELAQLDTWNTTATDFGRAGTLPECVAATARRTPGAVAVVGSDGTLTYEELDARSSRIARRLTDNGVRPGDHVGLCLERSGEAITALLGILKTGAAYVPLVPDLPPARLAAQIAQAGVRMIVTRSQYTAALPDAGIATVMLDGDAFYRGAAASETPGIEIPADATAYVLFTSGSTGEPKGVAVTHANVMNYAHGMVGRLDLAHDAPLAFATVTTLGADLGNTAIFPALLTGGTLHVIAADVTTDATRFGEYFARHQIDLLKITPNHLRALLAGPHGDAILPRRWLALGGEALSWELADQILRSGRCRLLNHYGPTETTVGCATFEVTPDTAAAARAAGAQTVPIGLPLPNVQLHIVDPNGEAVPVGIPGELHIGGAGVTRGYVNQPDRTAESFVKGRGTSRVYRSGDRVRRLPDGSIEFLGRLDGQVKIRGFRVELGEIEQALATHPGIAQAAAVLRPAGAAGAEPVLVAYVALRTAGYAAAHAERPTTEILQAWIGQRLPEYMVPGVFVFLPQLPLTGNGKVDRGALPDLDIAGAADAHVVARTPLETALVQIWSEVLKREQVGVTDNFLALGGHSLLAIRVLGRISKQFGVRLPLRVLFEKPTIEQLAEELDLEVRLAALEKMSDEEASQLLAADPARKDLT